MATGKRLLTRVLQRIAQMLTHEYKRGFVQRYDRACRLNNRDKTRRPGKPVDQIRLAVDHFAVAIGDAMDLEVNLRLGVRKEGERSRQRVRKEIWLHLERARKHIIAAQFYSLHYHVSARDRAMERLLNSPLCKNRHEFDKFRKRYRAIRSTWKPLTLPQDDKTEKISETRAEIRRLKRDNLKLDASADALDILYLRIQTQLDGQWPLLIN
jgi:hypothetical protein